jgi:hypothetical protein
MDMQSELQQLRELREFWLQQSEYAEQSGDVNGLSSAQRMVSFLEKSIVRAETRKR